MEKDGRSRPSHSIVLPSAGIGVSFNSFAKWYKLYAIVLPSDFVNALSRPASMYESPGPASPTQYVSTFGGTVKPMCDKPYKIEAQACFAPSSFPVTTTPPTLL